MLTSYTYSDFKKVVVFRKSHTCRNSDVLVLTHLICQICLLAIEYRKSIVAAKQTIHV